LAIDAAKLAVEKAEALVRQLRPLRERGEISPLQMFEAELAAKQAHVQQETAEAQFRVAMLGPRPQAVDEAKARIVAADAAVSSAKTQLDLHTIRAPIDGVLDSLSCRLGQTLALSTTVGEVVDLRQVYVQVWLPAPDARLVRTGQTARITASEWRKNQATSLPSESGQLVGKVTFVGRAVDPQTGNLPVRILVDNSQERLPLGQTVAATIAVAEQAGALAVPAEAIEDLGEGPVLNVVREGKSAVLHPRLGARDDQWVEVVGTDLREGELVIVEGGYNLPEGTEVTVAPAHEAEKGKAAAKKAPAEPSAEAAP
jgi:RND family efflux transporter MFP subunit